MPRLGLLLLLAPFLEFYVLVEVGARIGAFNALMLVILFAAAGVWIARRQGMSTLARIQQSLAQGVLPADDMLDGLLLLAAGLLMVFPGFVSDAFGIALLLPPVRLLAARLLRRHMTTTLQTARETGGTSVHVRTWHFGPGGVAGSGRPVHPDANGRLADPRFGPGEEPRRTVIIDCDPVDAPPTPGAPGANPADGGKRDGEPGNGSGR